MSTMTHVDEQGKASMVDITGKENTLREAVARGYVKMSAETLRQVVEAGIPKGDVLGTARIAGVMAAKRTADLIPLCHPLNLTSVEITFDAMEHEHRIVIESQVKLEGKTGVEMEALVAVTAAALTIYDMCKAVDREMTISDIHLVRKRGGKSGDYIRRGQ